MKYFFFQIYHNDSYLLEVDKVDRYKYVTCDICNMILNKRSLIEAHLPFYRIKRKKYHLSGSYDGFNVVSQKFKELYDSLVMLESGQKSLKKVFVKEPMVDKVLEKTEK